MLIKKKEETMAAFKCHGNIKNIVVKTKLKNPLPCGCFKTCSDTRCLLWKQNSDADDFSSTITGHSYKFLQLQLEFWLGKF